MTAAPAQHAGAMNQSQERARSGRVHRIEVHAAEGHADVAGEAVVRDVRGEGHAGAGMPSEVRCAAVYLIEAELRQEQVRAVAEHLLADRITQRAEVGAAAKRWDALIEVHPLPGVMDPDAEAVELALRTMLGVESRVVTGKRYEFSGISQGRARAIAERMLANSVIHAIHDEPYHPDELPKGKAYELVVREVGLRELSDEELMVLSRRGHLFLSLEEMRAIQAHYRVLGREPREIELETLAQTWSEHCVHKTLKSTVRYVDTTGEAAQGARPGHTVEADGSVRIENLLKSTVAAATHELMAEGKADWCLSVFEDNSGVIEFDDEQAVCFKVETHNHPSAIEPYGGAATGIGGCIRDIMGTGLGAKPIAATDVFCVGGLERFAMPGEATGAKEWGKKALPAGCLHPKRVLRQVVSGVRDYGNRMGIPTVNGTVWFDDRYVGNPLVFCGCVGVMPRRFVRGGAKAGDRIVALGGRTGRDGIHGATFSSAELTDSHAEEFSHAVQIGNAVTEKMVLDAILEARDAEGGCVYSGITDCGAGGFSSAVGEMGRWLGAEVNLEQAPLKYEGLTATEIWISEAQERMVLAVPAANMARLAEICRAHEVEMSDLGVFGTAGRELVLRYEGTEVGRMSMEFLHEGVPMPTREARWSGAGRTRHAESGQTMGNVEGAGSACVERTLKALLGHGNIASKRCIIRQYDHEVQGRTVIHPLTMTQRGVEGPSDAAVLQVIAGKNRGVAIGNGLASGLCDDPYMMALAAVDECVRNLVCVGADAERIAILDNFCWPGCNDEHFMGLLVRAAQGCYDAAKAYGTPFISGKDSLNNQFTTECGQTIRIPPTLLISGLGIVPDLMRCVTMDGKQAGNLLVLAGQTGRAMGGSHYQMLEGSVPAQAEDVLPTTDLVNGPRMARAVHELVKRGLVRAAHDCSEGGLLVGAAEMAFAGELGLQLELSAVRAEGSMSTAGLCFSETPGRYLLEVERKNLAAVDHVLRGLAYAVIGEFNRSDRMVIPGGVLNVRVDELREAWNGTLNW